METHQCFDTRLGRQMGTAQSILTRFGPKHRDLHVGNWNVSSLNEKKQELYGRQTSIIFVLLDFPLPSVGALILLSLMKVESFSTLM